MTSRLAVYLEAGGKRVFACAVDWPGWSRAGKTEDAAITSLLAYAPRYAEVAGAAGERLPEAAPDRVEVLERIEGNATTDFGAPGRVPQADLQPLGRAAARRLQGLMRASWELLDRVAGEAPPVLRKGPRGGGRDRDAVVRHVLGAEAGYARSAGLKLKEPPLGDPVALAAHREAILGLVVPTPPDEAVPARPWPARYLVRRNAWHVLDHAWEIQDRSVRP